MRERLLGLIGFRLAVAAVLLATFASGEVVLDAPLLTPFASVALGSIFATALIQIMLIFFGVVSAVAAVVQVGLDLALLGGIVSITGGTQSPFAFLFCLIVLEAALALPRRATVTTAVLAAVTLIAVGDLTPASLSATSGQVAAVLALGFLSSALMGQAQRAQSELLRLGNLHERVLVGLSSGILTTDKRGRVGFINPAGLAILKRTESVMGLPLESVSPELARLTPEALDRGEVEVRLDGRALALGLSAVPLYDATNVIVGHTLIFRDLTVIRAAQRNAQLATVGRLAANLAHEVRNPLGAVSGSIDMIAQNGKLDGDEHRLIGIVKREMERLNTLITEFLDYARPQAPERVRYDVIALAGEVAQMFRQDASATVLHLTGVGLAHAVVDTAQLKQILLNLLKNAVQASPGEPIELEVRADVTVRLTVWNKSPPIEHPERIFEPFFTTKENGTGLGLAIVQQLTRQNGGEVKVLYRDGRVGLEIELPAG